MLLREVSIDVPRVPLLRFVGEYLQQIPARLAIGRRSGRPFTLYRKIKRFSVRLLVDQRSDAAGLGIEGEAEESVFERRGGGLQICSRHSRGHVHDVVSLVSERRYARRAEAKVRQVR